jgi:hypothetical protein
MEKKHWGYFPSMICSDGGGKFFGNRLVKFLSENHIQRLFSKPYHPKHNGRVERANCTIVESIQATLKSSKVQKHFWHKFLKCLCLAFNQIPCKNQTASLWSIIHGRPFPLDFLRPVGTPAVILSMNWKKGWKFDPKGEVLCRNPNI